MPNYLVNKNPQSTPAQEHEVHVTTCSYLPAPFNRQALSWHANCRPAVQEAKRYYHSVDGCAYCCPDCHTR